MEDTTEEKSDLIAMEDRDPIDYIVPLRLGAPNGTSLLAKEKKIVIQFPAYMEAPEITLSLANQDTLAWSWTTSRVSPRRSGDIVVSNVEVQYPPTPTNSKAKKRKKKPKPSLNDIDFAFVTYQVAHEFWSQVREKKVI